MVQAEVSLVVYTAIFGDSGDALHPAPNWPGVKFVAFVDSKNAEESSGWELRSPVWRQMKSRRQARRHKLLSSRLFPDVEYSLWVDGTHIPSVNPLSLVDRYLTDSDLATFKHKDRNCAYREVSACLRLKKDVPNMLMGASRKLSEAGYPKDLGLAETVAVLRRHTEKISQLNDFWWQCLSQGSVRDQIYFDFSCWNVGVSYSTFDGTAWNNELFYYRPHTRTVQGKKVSKIRPSRLPEA